MDNAASKPTIYPDPKKHYTSPTLRQLSGDEAAVAAKRLRGVMKLHVFGVPHTITRKDFSTCAFTQKVLKLCAMMYRRGHHVIHYGVEGSEVECTENVSIATQAEWGKWHKPPGNEQYVDGRNEEYLTTIYAPRVNAALKARTGPDLTEILCMTWGGNGQRGGILGVNQWEVETGIGYRHPWSKLRVFESYAWLHMHLGSEGLWNEPRWYWAVIPNSFDVNDFDFNPTPGEDFLYLGRLNEDKGVRQAIGAAKEAGRKITIVGQGDPTSFLAGNPHVTYLPPVGPEERRKLLANARAVFCPSHYVEPFCGTHVEAMMSGTPVITTDWGVFGESVFHGVTGYRCRTIEHLSWAAKNVHKLNRLAIKDYACRNYSLERIALMYEEYFQQVLNIRIPPGLGLEPGEVGLYMPNPDRQQLDWLSKEPPSIRPVLDFNIPHIPPPLPTAKPVGWAADQQWERNWWGLEWGPHWDEEIRKQKAYFRLIGFPDDGDFGDKTILDVGCGPVSMLLRTKHGFSRGVDPLAVSAGTKARYDDAGIEFLNIKAEEMPLDRQFDEMWEYNVLQHVDDPFEILRRMVACSHVGTIFRVFEWIDLGVCPGHPWNLTEDMFWKVFGGDDFERPIWNVGSLRDFGGTATNKYLAFVAVRKTEKMTPPLQSWRTIPGNFTFPDFYTWLAEKVVRPGAKIVEVGVHYGQSVGYLAEELDRVGAHPSIKIDLVDACLDRTGAYLDYVRHRIGARHHAWSVEAASKYDDGSIDAIFIDAEHTYEALSADLTAWLPKLRSGGIISGHDFCNEYPGVIRAVTERFPSFRIMRGRQWKDGGMVDAGGIYYCVWFVEP